MRSISLIAPAKINLYLEIIGDSFAGSRGDRLDGYHELAMILQSIELSDRVEIQASSRERICLDCQHPQVPVDESNLGYQAAELMSREFPEAFANYGGVNIKIDKQIPVAAGLAGGSSNAAAVLFGVNLLWKLGLTTTELVELGAKLGSDVPFCIVGGTAIATGRGEQLSSLPNLDNIYIVLGKYRSLAVSTAWAYKTYRSEFENTYIRDKSSLAARAAAVHSAQIVKAIVNQDVSLIAQKMHNDLEKVVLPAYLGVAQLRETFAQAGVLGTMMSGSGPTVFGLCENEAQAHQVKMFVREKIRDEDLELFVTKFSNQGIHVAS